MELTKLQIQLQIERLDRQYFRKKINTALYKKEKNALLALSGNYKPQPSTTATALKPTKESLPDSPGQVTAKSKFLFSQEIPQMRLSEQQQKKIAEIKAEMDAIDKAKATLSDTLDDFGPEVNLEIQVKEILALRDDWMRLKERLNAAYAGKDLDTVINIKEEFVQDIFMASLSNDAYWLKCDMDNMIANRSKKVTLLNKMKDLQKRSILEQEISLLNMKLTAAEKKLESLGYCLPSKRKQDAS